MKSLIFVLLSAIIPASALAQAPNAAPDEPDKAVAEPAEPSQPAAETNSAAQPTEPTPPARAAPVKPEPAAPAAPREATAGEAPAVAPVAEVAGGDADAAPAAVEIAAPAAVEAAAPTPAAAPTAKAAGDATQDPGEELFAEKCGSCHSVGKGDRVGPDLKGAHERRSADWLAKMIKTPNALLGSDPDARALLKKFNNVRMPDLGLNDAQVATLIEVITRCSVETCNLAGLFVPITEATPADAELGRQLFVGEIALKGDGPPCISCHIAAGSGAFIAGGTLAKDLSNVFARLGDEGLDGAIKNPPFPLMKDIYAQHKLDKDEAFALRAFFSASNRTVDHGDSFNVVLASLVGTGLCLIILNLFWRRRLRGVREPMLRSQGVNS